MNLLRQFEKAISCIPTQLNVTKHPKFQQTADRSLVDALFGPQPIPAKLKLEYAILRDMRQD
jgi:hypothetical protein